MAPSAPACSRSGNSWAARHRTPADHPAVGNQAELKRHLRKRLESCWWRAGDHRNSAVQISHGSSRNSAERLCWIRHKVEFVPCHLCCATDLKTQHNKLKHVLLKLLPSDQQGTLIKSTSAAPFSPALVQNIEITKPFTGCRRFLLGDCSWLAMKKSGKRLQVWPVWIYRVIFICQFTNQILFQVSWKKLVNNIRQQLLMQPEPQTRWSVRHISQGFKAGTLKGWGTSSPASRLKCM